MPASIHHLSVFVNDMRRSIELFQGLLGLEVVFSLPRVRGSRISRMLGIPDFEAEMVFLRRPDQAVGLELVRLMDGGEKPDRAADRSGFSLSFTIPDLDEVYARLGEAGWIPVSEPLDMIDPDGRPARIFCFHTDEGILIELIERPAADPS